MLTDHVKRGLQAGLLAGGAYGLFVALLANPLISYAETFEHGHSHGGGGPVVSNAITSVVSVAGGVSLGVLFGVVGFGVIFYFIEPAIPGVGATKSYLLGAAGFVSISGAPWLALPPQPPGIEQALGTEPRLLWYVVMVLAGALACGLAGYAYSRLRLDHGRGLAAAGSLLALVFLPLVAAFAPANPVSGSLPVAFVSVFRAVTLMGQLGLWFVLASAHAWFRQRSDTTDSDRSDQLRFSDTPPIPSES
jgi:predicted cobalt transporter CbtA